MAIHVFSPPEHYLIPNPPLKFRDMGQCMEARDLVLSNEAKIKDRMGIIEVLECSTSPIVPYAVWRDEQAF
jgi:hypothetical protein